MGVQEWLNKNPRIGLVGVGVLLVLSVVFSVRQLTGRGRGNTASMQAFFSADDGQSYFRDDAAKLPPFDYSGTTAYGAVVLRCAGGKPFVAYLQRYDATAIAEIQEWMKQSKAPNPVPSDMVAPPAMEVKKPGKFAWVSKDKDLKQYLEVTTPKCPDGGSGPFATVTPDDPDSGATK